MAAAEFEHAPQFQQFERFLAAERQLATAAAAAYQRELLQAGFVDLTTCRGLLAAVAAGTAAQSISDARAATLRYGEKYRATVLIEGFGERLAACQLAPNTAEALMACYRDELLSYAYDMSRMWEAEQELLNSVAMLVDFLSLAPSEWSAEGGDIHFHAEFARRYYERLSAQVRAHRHREKSNQKMLALINQHIFRDLEQQARVLLCA